MPDFPSYWRKNNYVESSGDWVKKEGTGTADPDDEEFPIFHRANNYVWDPLAEEWVPETP